MLNWTPYASLNTFHSPQMHISKFHVESEKKIHTKMVYTNCWEYKLA